jgi:RHH-type proline utilization regulon transcriptional repressor/proline dehydrogenase/delta 1-pyrroline-5-carboxylate dehydrogenase
LRRRVAAAGVPLDDAPVLPDGRVELLRWVREQSVSVTNHRYGNLDAGPVPDLGEIHPVARA